MSSWTPPSWQISARRIRERIERNVFTYQMPIKEVGRRDVQQRQRGERHIEEEAEGIFRYILGEDHEDEQMKMLICHQCREQFYGGNMAKYCYECKEKRWAEQNHRADTRSHKTEKAESPR